jgi:hypothetical protein
METREEFATVMATEGGFTLEKKDLTVAFVSTRESGRVRMLVTGSRERKIHIRGIKGKKCIDIAKKLERSLGRISEQRSTAEYYEHEPATEIHQRV